MFFLLSFTKNNKTNPIVVHYSKLKAFHDENNQVLEHFCFNHKVTFISVAFKIK